MKTELEIAEARFIVASHLGRTDMSVDQRMILQGMSCALQWLQGEGDTLARLIAGDTLSPGRTSEDLQKYIQQGQVLVALRLSYECLACGGSKILALEALETAKKAFECI